MTTPHLDPSFKTFLHKSFPHLGEKSIHAVLELSADGATVPFMARYRKEKTGNLTEVDIRGVLDCFSLWTEIVKRKEFVLAEIERQGNLTESLKKRIQDSWDLGDVEELYRPFKKKKKTKATLAREAGIEPFAEWIWSLGHGLIQQGSLTLEVKAKDYINPSAGYATYDEVLRGAQHILVERLSNNSEMRNRVRADYMNLGIVTSRKTTKYKSHSKYEMYAEFQESIKSLAHAKASHRYLALRRGWQEEELKVDIELDTSSLLKEYEKLAGSHESEQVTPFLKETAKNALHVHVIPSIVNELHRHLKENADLDAIKVFSENLRKVLLSSPFGAKIVLGVDPGLRTGCKLALLDKSGAYISSTVLQIHGDNAHENAIRLFGEVLKQVKIEAIAVGNGTGGREAEAFIRKVVKELNHETPVLLVNESGASVYSASDIAREEFPDLDITIRGAISIARRLQDPLAELVKIDPKSIGVGQYQHDVNQNNLKKSLHETVESCVNSVGIDVNTASESLLQYISGIGPALAKNIVQYRKEHGLFQEREELLKVPKFSTKGFEQAAGFLRIKGGKVFLDETGIHPERYHAVRDMAHELGLIPKQLSGENAKQLEVLRPKWTQLIGDYTFDDIIRELNKPGRDPRNPFKVFQFREDIHEVTDLKEGMICPGIVTNVTNFGAFIDIGVHQDGLVHISQLAHNFVDDPRKVVTPGDQVTVRILGVDKDKNQISLTMLMEAQRMERKGASASATATSGETLQQGPRPQRPSTKRAYNPNHTTQGASATGTPIASTSRSTSHNKTRGPFNKTNEKSFPASSKNHQPRQLNNRGPSSPGKTNKGARPSQPFNNPFAALGNAKKG